MGKNKSVISRLGGQKFIVLLVVIGLILFFSAVSPDFRKYTTVMSILDYSYYIALMAIGVTFPLITGGVDLSIGTGLICYSLTGGFLIVQKGWPVWAGILVTLLLSIVIGLLNGVLVSIMNLPPFLATLCTCMITRGLGSIFSKGFGISWPTTGAPGSWFRNIFKITVNGTKIPLGFLWVLLLVAVMAFVLNHIMAYVISGFFAGLAAIAYSAVFSTVQPGTGAGFELEAIGGAIIGGVSASGGVGSVVGSLIGVFVICLLKTGLPYIGLQANWQQIITGLVLIGAVLIDIMKKKKEKG